MIDLSCEELLALAAAAAVLPRRNGKRIHIATIYRWAKVGVRGVRLEVLIIGGMTYTSRQALQRFANRLTVPPTPPASRVQSRSIGVAKADEILDRAKV